MEAALFGLAWEVGCDWLTGAGPATRSELIEWTEQKAIKFGISFLGDAASTFVDAVIDAADDGAPNEAAEACNQVPDSGF